MQQNDEYIFFKPLFGFQEPKNGYFHQNVNTVFLQQSVGYTFSIRGVLVCENKVSGISVCLFFTAIAQCVTIFSISQSWTTPLIQVEDLFFFHHLLLPVTILRSPPLLAPVLRGCSCCPRLSLITSCRLSVVSLTSLPPATLHYSCFRYTTPPLCRHSPVIGRASDQMWNRTGGDGEIWRFVDCGKERVIN